MLQDFLVPAIVLLTSLAVYAIGRRSPHMAKASMRTAFGRFFECAGAFVVLLALNTGIVLGISLLLRLSGLASLSLYIAGDAALIILSALQAVLFSFWRHSGCGLRD